MTIKKFFVVTAVLLNTAASACSTIQVGASTPEYVRFLDTSAFSTIYPAEWKAEIFDKGIIVFAPPELVDGGELAASVTVYRDAPAASEETDAELLDHFLSAGPVRGEYSLLSPIEDTMVDGIPGLEVEIGSGDQAAGLHGRIEMVQLDNGAVYYFTALAPADSWEEDWMLIEPIIRQVEFTE